MSQLDSETSFNTFQIGIDLGGIRLKVPIGVFHIHPCLLVDVILRTDSRGHKTRFVIRCRSIVILTTGVGVITRVQFPFGTRDVPPEINVVTTGLFVIPDSVEIRRST